MDRARLRNQVVVAAILCMALAIFLGCSPGRRYQTLTFFFDGVPAPRGTQGGGAAGQPVNFLHKPYAEGKCGACHASDEIDMSIARPTRITELSSTICLKCHEGVRTQYPVMHGPVASAQCMRCHTPHESSVAHLLKASSAQVCQQCHTRELMVPLRVEHQDQKADCVSCHSGHGSTSHGLLRTVASATTRPANAPTVPSLPSGKGEARL